MNDLEEEFHERALLAKSRRFFKKGSQRFSGAKATDETQCHKCGRKGHFVRDCFSKTSVPSYSSPFQNNIQPKFSSSSQQKPELRPTKDFETRYNKVKAKLALLSSNASTLKVLMTLADDENVAVGKESARNGKWVKISMRKCINEQIPNQKKRILGLDQLTKEPSSSRQTCLVFVKSSAKDTNVSIPAVEKTWLFEAKGFKLPNHDTGRILPAESQVKSTDRSVNVTNSSVTDYDSADEALVCSTPHPPLEKLAGAEPLSRPKTIKSILKFNSTFKAETLKGVTINEPTLAPANGNKNVSASKRNSAPAGKLKNVKPEDDIPLSVVMKEHLKSQGGTYLRSQTSRPLKPFPPCKHCGFNDHPFDNYVNYPICEICRSYDHDIKGHNRIISLIRGIKPRNPQQVIKSCETCSSNVRTTTDHNDIEWFKRGEVLQAKKAASSNATRLKTHTDAVVVGLLQEVLQLPRQST
ncbi:retrovirus-related pol polyprotein from transposon TNT 1-94 [Tanacetum coccineum]|uniref:Retrovirus-related pol polyprotein from transposon TNT 1-94 n=1 Tax=Tanacetum coccineum TaxID=301880 RepID=A0ABQ5F0Y7_9ASTR